MAARKSCTHMTWAEAKAKSGISSSGKASTKLPAKRETHGKLLAAKILAKQGPSADEKIQDRQAARRARRDQERQQRLDAQREAEKEKQRLEDVARPHDLAIEKLKDLAMEYQTKLVATPVNDVATTIPQDQWNDICESKQLQVDEIIALQAIYADMDVLTIPDACQFEELQSKLEEWQMDQDDEQRQKAVVQHAPVTLTLQKSIEDPSNEDAVAHLFLHVAFPSDYPLHTTPPKLDIVWFLLTQKSMVVSSNKFLDSTNLGTLDEAGLKNTIEEQSQELLGMPSVYELLDTLLSERLFDFITRAEMP